MPRLLCRVLAHVFPRLPLTEQVRLVGGPADGLMLAVPRPAPPSVFAALRPMMDGTVLLASATDGTAVYVSALAHLDGAETEVAHYRRSGSCYLHAIG